jgi:hypothetical protein
LDREAFVNPSRLTMTADGPMLQAIGTGIALIGLCSVPSLKNIVARLQKKRDVKQDTYEDDDGKATPESVKAYSAKLAKSALLASAGAGLGVSTALLVISPHADGRLLIDSLSTGAWVRFCNKTNNPALIHYHDKHILIPACRLFSCSRL